MTPSPSTAPAEEPQKHMPVTEEAATEDAVLAVIAGMLATILDEYGEDDVEIAMTTTFNRDLELESIDLVTLAGLLDERYGGRINFAEFVAAMEFDEIIDLTVGRLVEHVVQSLKAAEAG